MLHFGNLTANTEHARVQPFLDKVIPLFQQYLMPSSELIIIIDEAIIAFRGKVYFRIYLHP